MEVWKLELIYKLYIPLDTLKHISAGADGGPRFRVCAWLALCSAPHHDQGIFHLETKQKTKPLGGGGSSKFVSPQILFLL